MAESAEAQEPVIDISEDEPDEYNVEAIRDKRINPDTGNVEYLVKWEDYPETDNTWEPIEHLLCPDLIKAFNEKEKNKRKRRSVADTKETKRTKRTDSTTPVTQDPLELKEDEDGDTDEMTDAVEEPKRPKGFQRGLELEEIIGACENNDESKLLFFVRWRGSGETELVSAEDIEEHAPKIMCAWYRDRLYESLKTMREGQET